MSTIDTTLILTTSKIETQQGEPSMNELPDVINQKPDVHRPMSRLYDRSRLQHTQPLRSPVADTGVLPVSPVANTYSDIEASLRRRTTTVSDVTTSLQCRHTTSDAHARTSTTPSDVQRSLQHRMTPSNVAVPSCKQVHRRKSEESLHSPEILPLFRRF